jgi:hypothetical protein
MAEQVAEKKQLGTGKSARKLLWYTGFFLALVLIILAFLWISGPRKLRRIEQRIAAIEAARAIPDEENAAVVYNELLETVDVLSGQPDFIARTDPAAISGPWLSEDHPEAAEWLRTHQDSIAKLTQACRKQQCRFPISTDMSSQAQHMRMLNAMRNWAHLLASAPNNDMAEGRVHSGLERCRCLIQMGAHLRQQLTMIDFLVGFAIEALGLQCLNRFIVEGDVTEGHLKTIEEALPEVRNNWARDWPQISEITKLVESCQRREFGYFRWLTLRFRHGVFDVDTEKRFEEIYLRVLAHGRGTRVLLALRRYKSAQGSWPESLEDVKSLAPPEVFVDAINDSSFVYRLRGDSFTLYSKGQNNIDEEGKYKSRKPKKAEPDDWLIWPPRGRKIKQENANAE